jgi:hypothetical protein
MCCCSVRRCYCITMHGRIEHSVHKTGDVHSRYVGTDMCMRVRMCVPTLEHLAHSFVQAPQRLVHWNGSRNPQCWACACERRYAVRVAGLRNACAVHVSRHVVMCVSLRACMHACIIRPGRTHMPTAQTASADAGNLHRKWDALGYKARVDAEHVRCN